MCGRGKSKESNKEMDELKNEKSRNYRMNSKLVT